VEFGVRFSQKFPISNFTEIRPMGASLIYIVTRPAITKLTGVFFLRPCERA